MKILFVLLWVVLSLKLSAQIYEEVVDFGLGLSLDYSNPVLADLDGDGLIDMIVGNNSNKLLHMEQVEMNSEEFRLITRDFCGTVVSQDPSLSPVLCDLDGDGLFDLIVNGNYNLRRYEQAETNSYVFDICENIQIQGGSQRSLSVIDLDNNSLLDLFIGNEDGVIRRYEQTAEDSVEFNLVTPNFSSISTSYIAIPMFCDLDDDGKYDLLLGTNEDNLVHFEQTDINSTEMILLQENLPGVTNDVHRKVASVYDLDNDGLLNLLLGQQDGLVLQYEQLSNDLEAFELINSNVLNALDVYWNSFPCICDLDNDGYADLLIGDFFGKLHHYTQSDLSPFLFLLANNNFNNIDVGYEAVPRICDYNNDQVLDLLISNYDGYIIHYSAVGQYSLDFSFATSYFGQICTPFQLIFDIGDPDNDGLYDIVSGTMFDDRLRRYEQTEPGDDNFTQLANIPINADITGNPSPVLTDIDEDGLIDLMIGTVDHYNIGKIIRLEQEAPDNINFNLIDNCFADIEVNHIPRFCFYDVNYDNKTDLLIGDEGGGLYLFLRQDVAINEEQIASPTIRAYNYPNPFTISGISRNTGTTIFLEKSNKEYSDLTLEIYNLKGQQVVSLNKIESDSKVYSVIWNGKNSKDRSVTTGIYLYYWKNKGETIRSSKCLLIK